MLEFFKDNLFKILGGVVLLLVLFLGSLFFFRNNKKDINDAEEVSIVEEDLVKDANTIETNEEVKELPKKLLNVDVKGLVNKPGVYQVEEGTIINSVLELAGGLKKGATTKNINLSKKVSDEMVIYVYSEYQLNNMNKSIEQKECSAKEVEINSCEGSSIIVSSDNNEVQVSGKISINKGTKEQLMTLSGIGEAKALAIIKYREDNNGFKALEEIMNVSGIGEAAYNKIKDNIEL